MSKDNILKNMEDLVNKIDKYNNKVMEEFIDKNNQIILIKD